MTRGGKVFRDGKVYVKAKMCETCIFRRGNLMMLERGRVDSMVAGATKNQSCIPCHDTLYKNGQAVCAGFFRLHATLPLRLAAALDRIEFV